MNFIENILFGIQHAISVKSLSHNNYKTHLLILCESVMFSLMSSVS